MKLFNIFFQTMKSCMLRARKNRKVFYGVIVPNPIYVMNNLFFVQNASQMCFHYISMVQNITMNSKWVFGYIYFYIPMTTFYQSTFPVFTAFSSLAFRAVLANLRFVFGCVGFPKKRISFSSEMVCRTAGPRAKNRTLEPRTVSNDSFFALLTFNHV